MHIRTMSYIGSNPTHLEVMVMLFKQLFRYIEHPACIGDIDAIHPIVFVNQMETIRSKVLTIFCKNRIQLDKT